MLWLESHDKSVRFELMGGRSMIDRTRPESVHIRRDGLKGLVPPWKNIKQKGATQDGITFVTSLGDPIDVTINAVAKGRDGIHLRRVIRHLLGSIDPKKPARLAFFTQEMGHWWADLRWEKTLPGALSGAQQTKQNVDLVLQADHGFWQTHPHVTGFEFTYDGSSDFFNTDYEDDAGPNWPMHFYDGATDDELGHPYVQGGELRWLDDPDDPLLTEGVSVVLGPHADYETDDDTQVVSIVLGSFQELTFPDGAENHIWLRMGKDVDGNWDGSGVRVSIGPISVELSYFIGFVETRMKVWANVPSLPKDRYTAIAGVNGNPRAFQIQRNGLPVWNHIEAADGPSPLGPDNRGIGLGMRAGAAIITQATPATVREFTAGTNIVDTQSGFLECYNVGDQDLFYELTVFGPGTFKFYNGPGATDYVEFGPLLPNQVMHIRTDPRRRSVRDLTSTPPTPQELTEFQEALHKFAVFASGKNIAPLFRQIESRFGIRPPQGEPFSLMKGRFSDAAAIPPMKTAGPPEPHYVKVEIANGTAASGIIASGVPLRRLPF